jgi:hypothetical protein
LALALVEIQAQTVVLLLSAQLLPVAAAMPEHGINKLLEIQVAAVEVVQIHPLTVADYGYSVALELQDKDSPVVAEYASTMTAKIHTMVVEVEAQAALVGQVKTKTNKLPPTAALVQPVIS